MTKQEQFEKLYKKHRVKYFEKYFIGNNINKAIYEASKDVILELTVVLIRINTLIDCLCILRSDKNYFSQLDADCKRRFRTNIIGLKSIRRSLNDILKSILKGLQEE